MSNRVFPVFVHPRVQRGDVDVMNFFSWCYGVVEFDCIGSACEEGISGFEWLYYFKGVEKLLQVLTSASHLHWHVLKPRRYTIDDRR